MRLSKYYSPTMKDSPASADVASHKLMLRAGMIKQQSSGIYSWLPLGVRVLKNIERIIREEMDNSGALEVIMPCIQSAELWEESGRYDGYGKEMLRIKDRHDNNLLFGPTAEESISDIIRKHVNSHKDFPRTFYQIHWKFRDEIRPRFGVLRGREFLMKDAYSFDLDESSSVETYDKVIDTYIKILKRIGLKPVLLRADAGVIGGTLSHEFHVIAETGESEIFYDSDIEVELTKEDPDVHKLRNLYAMADDMHKPGECDVSKEKLKHKKSIEVGHIFSYGTKYSESMNVYFMDKTGKQSRFFGGCYGLGVSRLVAAVIECFNDDNGIIWPKSIAPFHISLVNLHTDNEEVSEFCDRMYRKLKSMGLEVLYDDTSASVGNKFAKHDLLGSPYQIIGSSKLTKDNSFEIRDRKTGDKETSSFEEAIKKIEEIFKNEF
jgi:prolyl-tRNA synthetase